MKKIFAQLKFLLQRGINRLSWYRFLLFLKDKAHQDIFFTFTDNWNNELETIERKLRFVERSIGLPKHSLYLDSYIPRVKPAMSVSRYTWGGHYIELDSLFLSKQIKGLVFLERLGSLNPTGRVRIRIEIYYKPYHLNPLYNPAKPLPFKVNP